MKTVQPERQTDALRNYVQQTLLGGRLITDTEELLLSGMIDSLGVMSLVGFVEETYGIDIPFEDMTLENLNSIDAILRYADARQSARC
ncbi:acyl carrier protein [Ruegeria sp. SCPT10]|uniref:acyl carrier protein n=1 Tax=Ruegeria sp. SCP10 TaxID=3141377 RepID=UPI003334BC50